MTRLDDKLKEISEHYEVALPIEAIKQAFIDEGYVHIDQLTLNALQDLHVFLHNSGLKETSNE